MHHIYMLKKTVKTTKPDVIVVCDNGFKAFLIPFVVRTNIPIVFENHTSKYIQEHEKPSFFHKILSRIGFSFKNFAAKKFTKFIALSDDCLREWNLDNAVIIPNPLWFKPRRFSDLSSKKVIAVGKHSFEKGQDRLLQIWKNIVYKHPDWILNIYGTACENFHLQKMAFDLNILQNVNFHEPVNNIEEKYFESAIMATTSRFEGFGMAIIEAMACGLPCVAFDCPCGPRSIVENNKTGFLVEDGNIDAFTERLVQLIDHQDLRNKMGEKAKERAEKYDLHTIMNRWNQLFLELTEH